MFIRDFKTIWEVFHTPYASVLKFSGFHIRKFSSFYNKNFCFTLDGIITKYLQTPILAGWSLFHPVVLKSQLLIWK